MNRLNMKADITFPLILMLISCMLMGCEVQYFTEAQPVDRKNLPSFPAAMRGVWSDKSGKMLTHIERNTISLRSAGMVYPGVSKASPLDTLKNGNRRDVENAVQSVVWSTDLKRLDTVPNFIVRGSVIYKLDDDQLTFGAPFHRVGDSLQVNTDFTFTLNQDIFLRKVDETSYIINARMSDIQEEMNGEGRWWSFQLWEIPKRDSLFISNVEDNIEKSSGLIHSHGSINYYDIRWSAREILALRDSIFGKRDAEPLVRVRTK